MKSGKVIRKPASKYYKDGPLSESAIVEAIHCWLKQEGWHIAQKAQLKYLYVDVSAHKSGNERRIEVKGRSSEPHGDFLEAVGQLIRMIENKNTDYFLCLPDTKTYRNQACSLPLLVRKLLHVGFLFVNEKSEVRYYTAIKRVGKIGEGKIVYPI